MLTKLYRKYVSQAIRDKIYEAFLGRILFFFRNFKEVSKAFLIWLFLPVLPKTPENKCYAFMGKHGLTPYPYPFMLEYKKMPFAYVYDEPLEMRYVIYQGKKLYFPKECDKNFTLEVIYKSLLIEQDPRSPHRYIANLNRLAGKTILDIGVAEGIFSLAVIEIITHAYLFECDEMWIKALNATFAPWKEKVTIVPKYVSDKDDENNITIDHFLEGKSKNNLFLKMDIEGYEQAALKGAANLLQTAKDVDYSITTYHRTNDAVEIDKMLSDYGFESEFTEGFLYFEKELRRAIIRGDQACFVLEKCK